MGEDPGFRGWVITSSSVAACVERLHIGFRWMVRSFLWLVIDKQTRHNRFRLANAFLLGLNSCFSEMFQNACSHTVNKIKMLWNLFALPLPGMHMNSHIACSFKSAAVKIHTQLKKKSAESCKHGDLQMFQLLCCVRYEHRGSGNQRFLVLFWTLRLTARENRNNQRARERVREWDEGFGDKDEATLKTSGCDVISSPSRVLSWTQPRQAGGGGGGNNGRSSPGTEVRGSLGGLRLQHPATAGGRHASGTAALWNDD